MAVFVKLLPFFQKIPFKLSIDKGLTNLKPFNNLAKKNISDVCILKKMEAGNRNRTSRSIYNFL